MMRNFVNSTNQRRGLFYKTQIKKFIKATRKKRFLAEIQISLKQASQTGNKGNQLQPAVNRNLEKLFYRVKNQSITLIPSSCES